MPQDDDEFDFFVSYARKDDANGWIGAFVDALLEEHRTFFGGRSLVPFFDTQEIRGLDDWQIRISHGVARSRLFLAFISPHYFASEWCRREWYQWIDTEIAKHILTSGAAPICIIEVPGLESTIDEEEVVRQIARLCDLSAENTFLEATLPVLRQIRRRQFNAVQPFYSAGLEAIRQKSLREVINQLARDLDERAGDVRRAAESENHVPPYNPLFSGRLDELLELREQLKDNRSGVIAGVHGLGGIGKTELALTYAHAFAGVYPGGRFLVPCEGKHSLQDAVLHLGEWFRDRISDDHRKNPEDYFRAISACLHERLERLGHILLVLDNVTDPALLTAQQTDSLTSLGANLHLLATTRLLPSQSHGNWLTVGELPEIDAVSLFEKHRPFADDGERDAATRIVRRLGGFTLAVELVAAWLASHPSVTYASFLERLSSENLEAVDGLADDDVELRRHNHERRVHAVLGPTLDALTPEARRTIEYAAFLPPDNVALPWLYELTAQDFPEIVQPSRPGYETPWSETCRSLFRLALFSRTEGESGDDRLVRIHRLVQDVVQKELPQKELSKRKTAVDKLVRARIFAQGKTTDWQAARWELEPLDALANLWADTNQSGADWLLNSTGVMCHTLGEWTHAERLLRRAIEMNERSWGPDHVAADTYYNNLGGLLKVTGRFDEAKATLRKAIELSERRWGKKSTNHAGHVLILAELLIAMNELKEAEALIRTALTSYEDHYGPDHVQTHHSLGMLATLLFKTNRMPEAEELMRRELEILERDLDRDHPDVATCLSNLAGVLQVTNRLEEAEPHLWRALEIRKKCFGPNSPKVGDSLGALASFLQAAKRAEEAEPLMRESLTISKLSYGPDSLQFASSLGGLGLFLYTESRFAEGEPLVRHALDIEERIYGPDHTTVARRLGVLALFCAAANRNTEAESFLRRTLNIHKTYHRTTGHRHRDQETVARNYIALLSRMGRTHDEIVKTLNELAPGLVVTKRANTTNQ